MEGYTPNHEDLLQRPGPNFMIQQNIGTEENPHYIYTTRDGAIEMLQACWDLHDKWMRLLWYGNPTRNKDIKSTVNTG